MIRDSIHRRTALWLCSLLISNTAFAVGSVNSELTIVKHSPTPSQAGVGFVITSELDSADGLPLTGTILIEGGGSSCTITLPNSRCLLRPSLNGERFDINATYSGDAIHAISHALPLSHEVAAITLPTRISTGDGGLFGGVTLQRSNTFDAAITPDARYIAYAADVVSQDDRTFISDIALFDREQNSTRIISVDNNGEQVRLAAGNPDISNDGRNIVYTTAQALLEGSADNAKQNVYLFNAEVETTSLVSSNINDSQDLRLSGLSPKISGNGQWILYMADEFSQSDFNQLYLYQVASGEISIVPSLPLTEGELRAYHDYDISDDGTTIVYSTSITQQNSSEFGDTIEILLYDRNSETLQALPIPNPETESPRQTLNLTLSGNGEVLYFESTQNNIVAGDTNSGADIFRFNTQNNAIDLASVNSNDEQLNGSSSNPISNFSGQQLAFSSNATNIDDIEISSDQIHSYIRNFDNGDLRRISLTQDQQAVNAERTRIVAVNDDMRSILWTSRANIIDNRNNNEIAQLYLRDETSGSVDIFPQLFQGEQSDGTVSDLLLSDNGKLALFTSAASTLSEQVDHTSFSPIIYVRDLANNTIEPLFSIPALDTPRSLRFFKDLQASEDGRYVVFISSNNGFADHIPFITRDQVFLVDRESGVVELISRQADDNPFAFNSSNPVTSNDGKTIAWETLNAVDINGESRLRNDIFLLQRDTSAVQRISVDTSGAGGLFDSTTPIISGDGTVLTFTSRNAFVESDTNDDNDVYAYNIQNGVLRILTTGTNQNVANGSSQNLSISTDGRFLLLRSLADNLTDNDFNQQEDFFLLDQLNNTTTLVNRIDNTRLSLDNSACLSANGRYIAFTAENRLYLNDTNTNETIDLIGASENDSNARITLNDQCFSNDGHIVAFISNSNDISAGIDNNLGDAFIHVNPFANTAPVAFDDTYQTLEDQQLSLSSQGSQHPLSNDTDADGDTLSIVDPELIQQLEGLPGVLTLSSGGRLDFTPASNTFGAGQVSYDVSDGLLASSATITIEVISVNDQPRANINTLNIQTFSNAGAQTINGFAEFDPGADNELEQSPQYIISNVSTPERFAQLPEVTAEGSLSYRLIDNVEPGFISFDLQVQDDGGTENGGIDRSEIQTITIEVLEDVVFTDGFE